MTWIRRVAAGVVASAFLFPGVAQAASEETGTVEIELRFDEAPANWGAILSPSGSDCTSEESFEQDPPTQVLTCSEAPAGGSLQIEVFDGFVVTGACGDAEPARIRNGESLAYDFDDDLRVTCRIDVSRLNSLEITTGVFSDLRLEDDPDFNRVLLVDDTGNTVDVGEECDVVAREPVQEVPVVVIGYLYQCALPADGYTLRLDPVFDGATYTIKCEDEAARSLPVACVLVDVSDDASCRVETRDVDGPLPVTIEGESSDFDPSDWSVEVTKGGSPVEDAIAQETGQGPTGQCQPDRRCLSSGVAVGEYDLVIDGSAGVVSASIDGTPRRMIDGQNITFVMTPGVARNVQLVVEPELPATGSDGRTWVVLWLACALLATGIGLSASARWS